MFRKQSLLVMLIVGALLAACGAQLSAPQSTSAPSTGADVLVSVGGGAYANVTPQQLTEMLKSKDFFFVNTHIPYEGEIEQTDAFIPYDQTAQRLSDYPADKNAKIFVYCRSGRMSAIAAQALVKAGYTDVWNLDGGMIAWEKAGFELIRK